MIIVYMGIQINLLKKIEQHIDRKTKDKSIEEHMESHMNG